MYADDTQVYVFIEGGRQNYAIQKLQACIDICIGLFIMVSNSMQIKLRFFILPVNRQSHQLEHVTLDESVVNTIAHSARNLGVKLDKHLTLNSYINDTCIELLPSHSINWDNTTVLKP